MSDLADEGLAELIAREQRGFRRILFAGVITLLTVALMSAAMGGYFFIASQALAETTQALQQQAFQARRDAAAQNNRIAAQDIAIRWAYDEMRAAGGATAERAAAENVEIAAEAARNFLLRGRTPSLDEQRVLAQFDSEGAAPVPRSLGSLLAGTASLVAYDTHGETIERDATELPPRLALAVEAFTAVLDDPALAPLGHAGLGWVRFEDASSERNNYAPAACELVFAEVAASAQEGVPSPQPLYWRAQCERKLGRTAEALADYARTLQARRAVLTADDRGGAAEMTLAMNAFHGVGTTLIAGAAIPEDAPGMTEALAIAADACPTRESPGDAAYRMELALSCLNEAIGLRRQLGQTENQLSGSGENISFAHLRLGDVVAAYKNAAAVESTGLFAWNEVVRALTAGKVAEGDAGWNDPTAAAAAAEARQNVGMFTVGQFNLCELRALLNPELYGETLAIIAEAHPGEDVGCTASE